MGDGRRLPESPSAWVGATASVSFNFTAADLSVKHGWYSHHFYPPPPPYISLVTIHTKEHKCMKMTLLAVARSSTRPPGTSSSSRGRTRSRSARAAAVAMQVTPPRDDTIRSVPWMGNLNVCLRARGCTERDTQDRGFWQSFAAVTFPRMNECTRWPNWSGCITRARSMMQPRRSCTCAKLFRFHHAHHSG
jgi:hypothetical protein